MKVTIDLVSRLAARAADRLGPGCRGRVAAGLQAALVLSGLERFRDAATYEAPRR